MYGQPTTAFTVGVTVTWVCASLVTWKSIEPALAAAVVVAVTLSLLVVAVLRSKAPGLAAAVAWVASAATLLLRPCSADTMDWRSWDLYLSSVCGMASTCITELMSAVVSSPLASPSSEIPIAAFHCRK